MKNITKRIVSLLASVVTAASALTASYTSAFAEEQTNDTASSTSADTEIDTGGLLGDLFPDEFEQEAKNNDEAQKREYVIYKMEYDNSREKLVIDYSSKENCTIFVGFYNDEGTELYTSLNANVNAGTNKSMFIPLPEGLPEYYLIRAYMIGYLQEPLSKPYEYKKSTKVIQDILRKTPDDFDEEKVIRVDENDDYNFIVTKNEHAIIYSDDTRDTLVGFNDYTDELYFENIDKIKELKKDQDVLVYIPDDMLYFRVCDIIIDGTKATVTKQSLDGHDLIEFIKFDSSQYTGDVTCSVDTSECDEDIEYEILDNSSLPSGQNENGVMRQPAPSQDTSWSISTTIKINLAKIAGNTSKNDGNKSAEASISAYLEITPCLDLNVYYEDDLFHFEANLDFSFRLNVEGEIKATKKLPSFKIGPPLVKFSAIPKINVYIRAGIDVTISKGLRLTFDPLGGFDFQAKPSEVQCTDYLEFEFTIGLDAGIEVLTKKFFSVSIEPEIGIRFKSIDSLSENNNCDYVRHDCTSCVSQSKSLFVRVTPHVLFLGDDILDDTSSEDDDEDEPFEIHTFNPGEWEPNETEFEIKNEACHITNGIKYDGPCDNKSYKVIFNVYDVTDNAQAIKGKPVSGAKLYIKTGNGSFSSLENDYGDVVETNSNGVAEAWIKEKLLTDETCVVLAQSPDGDKGQVFVGKLFDLSLNRANSFEILLDNDVDGNPPSSDSDEGYCGYDYNSYDEMIVAESMYDPKTQKIFYDGKTQDLPSWTTWNYYNGDKKSGKVVVRVRKPTDSVKYEIKSSTCYVTGDGVLFSEYLLKKIKEAGEKVTTLIIDDGVEGLDLRKYPCNEYWFAGNGRLSASLDHNQNVKRVSLTGFSEIGSCFDGCSNLSEINFDKPLQKIDSSSFAGTNLESLNFPETLETIETCAFAGCKNLKEVTFNKGLQTIGNSAFQGCKNLQNILFNSDLKVIENFAFSETPVRKIDIPSTVKTIEYEAFYKCPNLREVYLHEGLGTIEHDVFNGTSISSINIPSSVKEIGPGAFNNGTLKTVIINGDLETVGWHAFYNTESLILNDRVTEIPEGAFSDCMNMHNVRFSENLNKINKEAFYNCDSLLRITLPDSLEYIEDEAFGHCNNLRWVTLPKDLKNIGQGAFDHNTWLESMVIPGSVEEIGAHAFEWAMLNDLTIENGVKKIGEGAFADTGLKSVVIPASVAYIGEGAFNKVYNDYDNDGNKIEKNTLKDIYIYNPDCELVDGCIKCAAGSKVTIHGYTDSTAYKYYEEFKDFVNFEELKSEQPVPTTTTTTATTTVTTTTTTVTAAVSTVISPHKECVFIAVNEPSSVNSSAQEILDVKNVAYFDQQTADENGTVIFTFVPDIINLTHLFISEITDSMVTQTIAVPEKDVKTTQYVVTEPATAAPAVTLYGDANNDGMIDMSDAVRILQSLANPNKYGMSGTDEFHMTEQGQSNGDVYHPGTGITTRDALAIQEFLVKKIDSLPVYP